MSAALCLTIALAGAHDCGYGYSASYCCSPYTYSYGTPTYAYSSYYYSTPYSGYSYGTPSYYTYSDPYSYGTTYDSYGMAYQSPYGSAYSPSESGYGYQSQGMYGGYESGSAAQAYRPSQPSPPQGQYEAGRPQARRNNIVRMTDQLRFEPAQITINVGETVRWTNTSRMEHTVTADPSLAANPAHVVLPEGAQPVHSGEIQAGDEFSHTFQTPGTYYYVCLLHEDQGMVGIVTVRAGGGPGGQNQGYEQPQGAGTRQGGGY